MKQTLILSFFFLYSLLVLGGCADMPQTGSIPMPADVDRYIVRPPTNGCGFEMLYTPR